MILEIFKDSFEYSFKEPKTILKLGILSFLNFLIVPYFLLNGYSYRITKIGINGMINGNDPLPEFKHWGIMFLEGVKIFIVRTVYLIPGTLIFFTLSATIISMGKFLGLMVLATELGVIAISTIVWHIFYLFSIVAVPNMINNNGSLKSAFKIREIIEISKSIGIFKYVQFYIGCIVLVLGIISATLLLIALIILTSGLALSSVIGPVAFGYAGIFISIASTMALVLIISPFFMVFESRTMALMYNTRES
ncbi:MAG: DUF4013 domain-containing protein [Methanobrevibacter sp.]|nr:DUF4013 domain-containing protein [Methanobrevibacter sp.]